MIASIFVFKYHVYSNYCQLCTSFLWASDPYAPASLSSPFRYLTNVWKFTYSNSTLNFLLKLSPLPVFIQGSKSQSGIILGTFLLLSTFWVNKSHQHHLTYILSLATSLRFHWDGISPGHHSLCFESFYLHSSIPLPFPTDSLLSIQQDTF